MSGAKSTPRSSAYKHAQESVQRADVGVEAQFSAKKAPKTYHYDSSPAPKLCWDENGERPFADWLLNLVTLAAEKVAGVVFAEPWVWAGKPERQQISVPTLPLFVHQRHSTQSILETLCAHKARAANLDLFGDAGLDVADKLDASKHKGPWTNRLILVCSLQVMNSLLEYEGMGARPSNAP